MKILIIEDEQALSQAIVQFLSDENYVCEVAHNFEMAREKINLYQYDCILVDITLPDGNGLKVIHELKSMHSQAGIIIISARNSLDDKILGLDIGADDYLTKPFDLPELNARIKALIRRRSFQSFSEIRFKNLLIDTDSRTLTIDGNPVNLTRKEYQILLYFIANSKKVISKGAIAEHLWGDHMDMADSYDFIYSQIKNLRKKLNDQSEVKYFHSVYGVGYKLLEN